MVSKIARTVRPPEEKKEINGIVNSLVEATSVSARRCHCGNPVLQSENAPRKTEKGPI